MSSMAVTKSSMLTVAFLVLAAVQASRAQNTDHEIEDAVNLVSVMKGMTKALECFGGTMKESLSVQSENSNTFRKLLQDSLAMQIRNSDALVELSDCSKDVEVVKENLAKSRQQVEELSANEGRLNSRIEDLEKSLKESQTLTMGLLGEIRRLNETITSQQDSETQPGCGTQHPRVNAQVEAYSRNKKWDDLRSNLGAVLDSSNTAKIQLQAVPDSYNSPLFEVAQRGYTELVKLLVCHGLPLDTAGSNRYTMLHGAAYGGQLETVKLLLKYGANIEAVDGDEDTPLINAARRGHLNVIQLLVEHGASISYEGNLGRTAQEWAASGGYSETVQFLSSAEH